MKLQKKVIVFGAGNNGMKLLEKIGSDNIAFFCDNFKSGKIEIETDQKEIEIISFNELIKIFTEYDIVLSVDSDAIREQLYDHNIYFWEYSIEENNYFNRSDISELMDREYMELYKKANLYIPQKVIKKNWYRTSYFSDLNEQLVSFLRADEKEKVKEFLRNIYSENIIYSDEHFKNRPGMRLVASILEDNLNMDIKVCDFACGHGELLKNLKNKGIKCYGIDISPERVLMLKEEKIPCNTGAIEDSGYQDEEMDVVIMLECLEHVDDPFKAIREAKRVLKKNGKLFVTVPYGVCNDFNTHVRHFYEDELYSVAAQCGFGKIKIMRIPYLNWTFNDNLFMIAEKKEQL